MEDLQGMGLFVAIVEAGQLSSAAHALGLSKSAVSKQLAALEDRLGARLLDRTTRSMRLTDAGEVYYRRAREIVAAAREAELELLERQNTAVGRLRVSAPVSFGQRYLGAAVGRFVQRYPEVEVSFDLSDRFVDMIEEGYDLAIRAGNPSDSGLVARRLVDSRLILVASQAYLDRRGRPRTADELAKHECLLYRQQSIQRVWLFESNKGKKRVRVFGRLESNNGDILADAARHGAGIAYLPDFIVQPFVDRGDLVSLLPTYCHLKSGVHAVYPSRRNLSEKIRLFIEEVGATLRR